MEFNKGAAQAAGIDHAKARAALDYLQQVQQRGAEGVTARMAFIRAVSELARGNAVAMSVIDGALSRAAWAVPQESTNIFRATYIEGERRPRMRAIAARFHMDKCTAHRHIKRVIEALAVVLFGIDGVALVGDVTQHAAPDRRQLLQDCVTNGGGHEHGKE